MFLLSVKRKSAIVAVLQLSALSNTIKMRIVRKMNFCFNTLTDLLIEPGCDENDRSLSFLTYFIFMTGPLQCGRS
ncbi:hypothetical protein EGK68_23785 [Enterobacter cloacae]|uniref:Uncharacterized protein n=1 Tax=Enterobacter cloacae TaxID=550 RepID=A0A427KFD6_ENTCL|nr:hypothetical protein EGK68_23785 [Enterobacter cloacae]